MFALPFDHPLPDRLRDSLPLILETGLALLLAVQAVRLVLVITGSPTPPDQAVAETAPLRPAPPLASHDDPFFPGAATAGAADALGYRLYGVRVDGANSSAILAHDGKQRAYAVGDVIGQGLVLDAVAADHVLLRAGGARHRLDLPERPAATGTRVTALPTGAEPAAAKPAAPAIDPATLLQQAGLRARESDGESAGFTVLPRGDNALLRQAGLQAGDVLLAVDGQPLTPERLRELKTELQGRDQATLTVQRDGQTRTLTLKARP